MSGKTKLPVISKKTAQTWIKQGKANVFWPDGKGTTYLFKNSHAVGILKKEPKKLWL